MKALAFFTRIGGRETILSYGISEDAYLRADYPELLELFRASVPDRHVDFLRAFEDLIVIGDYAFVHAGVNPEHPLESQKTSDLRWIRESFLRARGPFGKTIVHGNSIAEDAEVLAHRIGIDTGAYASGRLTALCLEGESHWLLQTSPEGVVKR
jgi:serine/threonine protein phosphatase 1